MDKCALCLTANLAAPEWPIRLAETSIGPIPVCGIHVDAALAKIGYAAPSLDIAGWLEEIDPQELQSAAVELVDSMDSGGMGKAFLSVLIDAAKKQAAEVGG